MRRFALKRVFALLFTGIFPVWPMEGIALAQPKGQSPASTADPPPEEWLSVSKPTVPPPVAAQPRRRGALYNSEEERSLLLGIGAGACFLGNRWAEAGPCVKVDFAYQVRFRGGAFAVGVEVGYERYSNVYQSGLVPGGPALSDISGLVVGGPLVLRFNDAGSAFTTYIGASLILVVQSSRYVLPVNQIVDTSAERIGVRPFFGVERKLGPGGVLLEVGYRATGAIEPSQPQVRHDGAQAIVGYRVAF